MISLYKKFRNINGGYLIIPAIFSYLLKNSEKNEGRLVGSKSPGPKRELVSFVCGLTYVASAFLFF